jgi:DNA-binding SARP family transcriptional activator/tetratricopeptide (TPR) repeat protein
MVEFGLLGPFEWRVANAPVTLRSPNSRTLLAALVVDPGRVVPVAELTEAIWGASQPDDPRRTLHVCLTRARASLAAAGVPDLIVSTPGGYRADIEPDAVDVTRFRRAVDRAIDEATRDDPDGGSDAMAEARRLWRGEPFTDIPSDYLHRRYGLQLTEQRLQAAEQWIDRRLATGHYADAVNELAELTAAYPLRERLWARLLTALHRSGRRSEALSSYHALRRQLADELGIEPGPELQQLYGAALRGAAVTAGQARPTGTAEPVVPRQIPSDVAGFTARAPELRRLDALNEWHERAEVPGTTVVVITGMAGVGKTTLAAHWARRVADHFPDGQLWLDLRGYDRRAPATPQQSIASVLRALGVPPGDMPADLDSQVGLYRSILDGRRLLLVLDNANGVDQVLPLIPGDAHAFVLVTSRNELVPVIAREGAHLVRLDPLTPAEARHMLEPRLGAERLRAEPRAVDGIIDNCYGLPLALALVAARAAVRPTFPLGAIEKQLAAAGNPLDRFAESRAVLSWSYVALTAPAARLFRLLGLHPTADASAIAAACLFNTTPQETRPYLDELAAAHLVTEHEPDRFTVHDLLRAYAAELAVTYDPADRRSAALRRILDWLTRSMLNARPLLQPSETNVVPPATAPSIEPMTFADERAAREWCAAERHNLVAGVALAYAHGFDDLCWRLAYATWIYLQLTGAWDDLLRTHETGLRAAERLGDRDGQAQILTGMAVAQRSTGDVPRAIETCRTALDIFGATGNTIGSANALNNLSVCYREIGEFDQALKCGEMAYALEEALDEPGNMAISAYQVATTLLAADRPQQAAAQVSGALSLFRRIGHRRGEARVLQLAATVHTRLGSHGTAVDAQRKAVRIYRELGDRAYEAEMLTTLGDMLTRSRGTGEGQDAWSRALAIYDELGMARATEVRARLSGV